jgi:hypothetical protein
MRRIRYIINLLSKPLAYFPLTVRGIFAGALAALCLLYFAKEYSDLIASILGAALLIVMSLFTLILLLSAPYIKRKLRISSSDQEMELVSRRENGCGFTISKFRIPPFFCLRIRRAIENKSVLHSTHILKGSTRSEDRQDVYIDTLHFPHRGIYECHGYDIELADILGLTRRKWRYKSPFSYHVYAPRSEIAPLPVMAASSQLGDTETSQRNKSGDLFNIRGYQPGDSLKRILWKVYARSGSLVVRDPEPAIIPEGEVAIYVCAQKREDSVASCALSYLRNLERQNIIYKTGFLGSEKIALDYETAVTCSIESRPPKAYETAFNNFVETLKNKYQEPHNIVLFFSESLISGTVSEELDERELETACDLLSGIMRLSENLNIQLHLASTPEPSTERKKNLFLNTLVKKISAPDTSRGKKQIIIPAPYPHAKVQIESMI